MGWLGPCQLHWTRTGSTLRSYLFLSLLQTETRQSLVAAFPLARPWACPPSSVSCYWRPLRSAPHVSPARCLAFFCKTSSGRSRYIVCGRGRGTVVAGRHRVGGADSAGRCILCTWRLPRKGLSSRPAMPIESCQSTDVEARCEGRTGAPPRCDTASPVASSVA